MSDLHHTIKPPFRYDNDGQMIFDSNNTMVLDVKGYGYIAAGVQYNHCEACAIQDEFGEFTANALNSATENKHQ